MKNIAALVLFIFLAFPTAWTATEVVVNTDNRQEITGKAVGLERAVVVLEATDKKGAKNFCSGALIDKNVVLTAAHCISAAGAYHPKVQVFAVGFPPSPTKKGAKEISETETPQTFLGAKIRRFVKQKINSPYPASAATALWVPDAYLMADKENKGYLLEEFGGNDFGLIFLDEDLGLKTGWFKLGTSLPDLLLNKPIILMGYSMDKPQKTLWKSRGKIGSLSEVDPRHVYHNASSSGGTSGGPIVLQKDPSTLVAVHTFEFDYDGNQFPNGGVVLSSKQVEQIKQKLLYHHLLGPSNQALQTLDEKTSFRY